jgi:hypothetical protein
MRTDAEIRADGFKVLADSLGEVEAERFVSLILREPFDYTLWQQSLFSDRNIQEISSGAMNFRTDKSIG